MQSTPIPPAVVQTKTTPSNIYLKILQWNICSVRYKIDYLKLLVNEYTPNIIILNETWLKKEHNLYFRNFTVVRNDRADGYGGVATLVKSNIPFSQIVVNDATFPAGFQYVAIKINNLTVVNMYCPPNIPIQPKFWERFVKSFHNPLIMVGDLNAHHASWDTTHTNKSGRTVHNLMSECELVVLNDGSSTRFTQDKNQTSAVDLTMCSSQLAADSSWEVIEDPNNSDHFPIIIQFHSDNTKIPLVNFQSKRILKKADWGKYEKVIENELNDDHITYEGLYDIISRAANLAIPTSKPVINSKRLPYLGGMKNATELWKKKKHL